MKRSKLEPWGIFKGQVEEEFETETEKEDWRGMKGTHKGLTSPKSRRGTFENGGVSYCAKYSRLKGLKYGLNFQNKRAFVISVRTVSEE